MSLVMFRNHLSQFKLFKLLIVSTMIYQLIDLTLEYRKYKTIVKSDLKYFESGDLPSITLCRKYYDWQLTNKSRMFRNEGMIYQFAYIDENTTSRIGDKIIQSKINVYSVPSSSS